MGTFSGILKCIGDPVVNPKGTYFLIILWLLKKAGGNSLTYYK